MLLILSVYWLLSPLPLQAEPTDEETRLLLEKSLSVIEIDKEIDRIAIRKQEAAAGISRSEALLVAKEAEIAARREEAGHVVRSYYMGERDMLLGALVSFDSLSELFTMLDYIDVIFSRDKNTLNMYQAQYRAISKDRDTLAAEQAQLYDIEGQLIAQRNRMIALQAQIDSTLSGSGDADRLRRLIDELTNYWQTVGLHEVNRYFGAMADAMQDLPEWMKANNNFLEIDGFNYTLRLPEDELNRFLREKNPMFDSFEFRFQSDKVIAHGKREGLEIEISGHYSVEDKPVNALLFHVDDLIFNDLHLPDTTRAKLEKQFDLGFYPQKIVPFVKADSVAVKDGELIVKLKVEMKL
jgi:hypothetical protein